MEKQSDNGMEQSICTDFDILTMPTGRYGVHRNVIEGPRWANFGKILRDLVWDNPELKLTKIETEKGWFRETIRFELEGPEHLLRWAIVTLYGLIEEWNSDKVEKKGK